MEAERQIAAGIGHSRILRIRRFIECRMEQGVRDMAYLRRHLLLAFRRHTVSRISRFRRYVDGRMVQGVRDMAFLRRHLQLAFRQHTAAGSGYSRILRTRGFIDLRRREITANRDWGRYVYRLYNPYSDPTILEEVIGSSVRRRTLADVYDYEFRVTNAREIDYISVYYPLRILISCPLNIPGRAFKNIRLAAHARDFDFSFAGMIIGLPWG